ncbi:MAG: hypothetical protein M1834_000353 [Cirrosporium novae-zelandiae]|nr:MAG: hypothetical protein M1834_000353 [Cirrosporium novae-zelandiae]
MSNSAFPYLGLRSLPGSLPHNNAPPKTPDSNQGKSGTMGAFFGVLKTVLIPALISLVLYATITFIILPFFRRYRQRYAQYLPLTTISEHTSTIRDRVSNAFMRILLPSSWRNRMMEDCRYARGEIEGSLFDEEEGEGMIGFDVDERRREALERRRSNAVEDERRLSRDLEEGFRDDSEDEDSNDGHT